MSDSYFLSFTLLFQPKLTFTFESKTGYALVLILPKQVILSFHDDASKDTRIRSIHQCVLRFNGFRGNEE